MIWKECRRKIYLCVCVCLVETLGWETKNQREEKKKCIRAVNLGNRPKLNDIFRNYLSVKLKMDRFQMGAHTIGRHLSAFDCEILVMWVHSQFCFLAARTISTKQENEKNTLLIAPQQTTQYSHRCILWIFHS